jgi:membrane-bound lytic murein transglycosylase D
VVRDGETLWSIAKRHGVTLDRLAASNSMEPSDTLAVGQVLKIPSAATTLAASDDSPEINLQKLTYIVRVGDTLSEIASKFHVRIASLLNWNRLHSPHEIKPGQRLVMFVDDSRRTGG